MKEVSKFQGHTSAVAKVTWSADETKLYSVSHDGSLCAWNFYRE